MSTKLYLGIAIRLIVLFAVGIAVTFLTPQLRDFLGDELHVHTKACLNYYSGCINSNEPDPLYDWGPRHYWYFWMMVCLFILSLINFVFSIIRLIEKYGEN